MAGHDDPNASQWGKCNLFMDASSLRTYDLIEVLRLTLAHRRHAGAKAPPMSEGTKKARDALADSPHSMYWINELGRRYAAEAQWDKCEIALLRGWKRAGEIGDSGVRFRFLMKLCEASYVLQKYRQALAVLRDIEEPEANEELKAYLVLACRVHACNDDLTGALQFFKRAVESEEFEFSVRILAMTMYDLRKVEAYEPAKHIVEKKAGPYDVTSMLSMLDDAAVQSRSSKEKDDQLFKYFVGGGAVVAVAFLAIALYFLEQWSLRKWAESGRKM